MYVIEQLQTELNKLKERKRKKQNKTGRSESELKYESMADLKGVDNVDNNFYKLSQ